MGFGDLPQELFHSRLLRILLHIHRCVCIGEAWDLCVIDFRKIVAGKARANTAVENVGENFGENFGYLCLVAF